MPTSPLPAEARALPLGAAARKMIFCAAWAAGVCLIFAGPLARFFRHALTNDNSAHTVLIPLICLWLLYLERGRIFAEPGSDRGSGFAFLLGGSLVANVAFFPGRNWSELNQLSAFVLAVILMWLAGFSFFFGRTALRRARFALTFLLLTIPIPDFLLDKAIYFLQKGSTEVSAVLFDLTGVPVLREGFVFHLARVNIEVARECSGIRSSVALLILAILVAHFCLRTFWKQVVLVLAGLFVMLLKNGVRIVTLTLLASYVDPSFLYGKLHRGGGAVFFLLGLVLIAPLVWLLERGEPKTQAGID